VPFPSLQVIDKRMVLRGATKDALKALPEFKQPEEAEAHRILDKAADAGVNFIDTADLYPPGVSLGSGASELITGRWLADKRGRIASLPPPIPGSAEVILARGARRATGACTRSPSLPTGARARPVRSASSRGKAVASSKDLDVRSGAARGTVRSCRQMASDVPPLP
jgi:hypothetical protein